MTAQETIIELRQYIQRLGINKDDNYSTQQLELAYNTVQDAYVESKVEFVPKLQRYIVKEPSALSPLISYRTSKPFRLSATKVYVPLPPDFRYLLGDSSKVLRDCDTAWATSKVGRDILEQYTTLSFTGTEKVTPNYYLTFILNLTGRVVDLSSTGFDDPKALYELVHSVLREANYQNPQNPYPISVYWEKYSGVFLKNTFIIVNTNQEGVLAGLVVDETPELVSPQHTSIVRTTYDGGTKEYPNRGIPAGLYWQYQSSSFFKTSFDSPLSEVVDDSLYVYNDNGFIVTDITLVYVRKQRRLSLSLNQSSELPQYVQKELVRLTAENIDAVIENQVGYQLKVNDNKIRIQE